MALLILVVGFLCWRTFTNQSVTNIFSQPRSATFSLTPGVPTILTEAQLRQAIVNRSAAYWLGPEKDTEYEVTLTTQDGFFVRYLPKGERAGSTKQYPSVGTYDSIDGYTAIENSNADGAQVERTETGAIVATFPDKPLSTYFAFPDATFQVEVFSPKPGEALALVNSGAVQLISAGKN